MSWLPTSSEGKQLFNLGLGSLIAMILAVACVFALVSVRLVFAESESNLKAQVEYVAALAPSEANAAATFAGRMHVWRVGADGVVKGSTLPAMVGQSAEEALVTLQNVWLNPMLSLIHI